MTTNKKLLFPLFILFSALGLAGCAAYYSIIGISTLFSGAILSVSIMASFLEIAKLCSVTFLYRYWHKSQKFIKIYMCIATSVVMFITSMGIFGFLSSAYQKSSIEYGVTQEKIKNTESQKPFIQDKISASKKRVDDLTKLRASQDGQISSVLTNEFLTRNPLQLKQLQQQTMESISQTEKNIKDENDKIQTSIEDIQKLDEKINQMKLGTAEKKDVQTFKFVADALGVSLDNVARWFIISIIFVFDPLAICLILAYNVAVYRHEDKTAYDSPKPMADQDEIRKMLSEIPKKEILHDSEPPILKEKTILKDGENPKTVEKSTSAPTDSFFKSYFKL